MQDKSAESQHTKSKKCLVFVISSLRMGGAEKVASFLANALSSEYKIIIALWNNANQFYILNDNIEVCIIESKRRGILGNIERITMLTRLFKEKKADLAISFIHQTNILSIFAGKFARIPVIATEHSIYDSLSKSWNLLRRLVYPYAKCVTTLTHKDSKNYAFLSNVCVMPNLVEIISVESGNYQSHKPYILSAGRMIASKHFEELLKAFALFTKNHKEYSLLLAGDGALKDKLEEQARNLKIKVVFLGKVENLYSAYKNAEFFALTSHKEGLSNVLIESLICGTPVVSYDCPYGPGEIIEHEKNGLLVELGNVDLMAESFEIMAKKRDIMAESTMDIKKRFGKDAVLESWKNLIQKTIK